jgi:polysaccharide biosynthesis PFTS motif protein
MIKKFKYNNQKINNYKRWLNKIMRIIRILKEYLKITLILIMDKKLNKDFRNLAIIEGMNTEQQEDFIKCVADKDFEQKFPISALTGRDYFLIQSNEYKQLVYPNAHIITISNPLLFLLAQKYRYRILFMLKDTFLRLDSKKKRDFQVLMMNIILELLNSFANLDYFTTISAGKSYPLAFYPLKEIRKYTTHVIHYSQNSVPIKFIDEGIDLPSSSIVGKDSLGDIHWVWTLKYAEYLEKITSHIVFRAVGSITFFLNKERGRDCTKKVITIFDVTPKTEWKEKSFYDDDLAEKFISDIVALREELPHLHEYKIELKPKRRLEVKIHSKQYIEYLQRMNEEGLLIVHDSRINPYQLISKSSLTISIPFTSIAYIGREIETKSIFYYPFPRKLSNPLYSGIIPLIQEKENLKNYLNENLR